MHDDCMGNRVTEWMAHGSHRDLRWRWSVVQLPEPETGTMRRAHQASCSKARRDELAPGRQRRTGDAIHPFMNRLDDALVNQGLTLATRDALGLKLSSGHQPASGLSRTIEDLAD